MIAVFTPIPEAFLRQFRATPDEARREFTQEIDRLKSAFTKGLRNRGETAMQWVDSYATAGVAPTDILKATVTAARALGVERERGTLRNQLAADIIATAGNPLEDIQALKRVEFVMKNGKIARQPPRN